MNPLILLGCLLGLAQAKAPDPGDADANAFRVVVERMQRVEKGLTDATFTFYKQEWVKGRLTPLDVMAVKWRKPTDVFLEFVGDRHTGRKVMYRGEQWNQGRMRVDTTYMLTPVLNLDPTGRMAMDGQRNSIKEMSVSRTVGLIVRDSLKVNDHPVWQPEVKDLGKQLIRGEAAHCFDTVSPKEEDPSFYAKKVKLCVNPDTGLPNLVQAWEHEDGALRLVEDFAYIGLKVNPGLTDADFDPETYGM